jgi:hypothetical protein
MQVIKKGSRKGIQLLKGSEKKKSVFQEYQNKEATLFLRLGPKVDPTILDSILFTLFIRLLFKYTQYIAHTAIVIFVNSI